VKARAAFGAATALAAVALAASAQAGPPGSTVLLSQPPGFGPLTPPIVNNSGSTAVGFTAGISTYSAPGHRLVGGPNDDPGRYVVFVSDADGISPDDDNRFTNVFVRDRKTGDVTLVSRGSNGAPANEDSFAPSISADGTTVAFESQATNLVPVNTNDYDQIYKRNLGTGTTTLVSRANGPGGDAGDQPSEEPSISGDGAAVAFTSFATNLGGGSAHAQVYVRDGTTTTLVSVPDSSTTPGNGNSHGPSLSDDGDHVAFATDADNIGVSDTNSASDVFVHTLSDGHTRLASVRTLSPNAGAYGDSLSDGPSISADGHRVAFMSYARNFSVTDPGPSFDADVYVHDFSGTPSTFLASQGGGARGNGDSVDASISASGARVAFLTDSTNLAGADTNGVDDVYVRDTVGSPTTTLASRCTGSALLSRAASDPAIAPDGTGVSFTTFSRGCSPDEDDDFAQVFYRSLALSVVDPTTWISRPSGDGPFRSGTNTSQMHGANRSDDAPTSLSGDGSVAVFTSDADELSAVDDERFPNVFARNAKTGETELISRATGADGAAANGASISPAAISADGRYVAFASFATNLVPNDTNNSPDVFVRDRVLQTTTRVSVMNDGSQAPLSSGDPELSADGQRVVFTSHAKIDPVDDDTDEDVYVRDIAAGTTTLASVNTGGAHPDQPSFSPAISGDGNHVSFLSRATNLSVVDVNAFIDVYVRDLTAHTTTLASARNGSSLPGNQGAISAELDFTGAHVAFASSSSNLVGADDGNGAGDVFVREPGATKTTLVSGVSATEGGNASSGRPTISGDGTRIAFETAATDLYKDDVNGVFDVAVRDLTAGTATLASRADGAAGALSNNDAVHPSISANGHCVAFDSEADNLVAGPLGTDFARVYLRALDADCGTPEPSPGPGPGPGPDPGPTVDTTAPAISGLTVSPATFRVSAKATAISAKQVRKGARIKFTLSEAAKVSLKIERKGKGRRKGSKCVARRQTGKRCTLYTSKGTLRRGGTAGANTVAFSGRIGSKKLAKGRYRITATATDAAGNKAKKKTVSFRIV
jgi:Tol biopolymer transport system component